MDKIFCHAHLKQKKNILSRQMDEAREGVGAGHKEYTVQSFSKALLFRLYLH